MKSFINEVGKKSFIISVILIAVCLILIIRSPGCQAMNPAPPPVSQSLENVVSIELLNTQKHNYKDPDSIKLLYTLSEYEFEAFWNEYMTIPYFRPFGAPPTSFGIITVRTTYKDGCVDMIGTTVCRFTDVDGNDSYRYRTTKDREALRSLFAKYVDISLIPPANAYIS